MAANVEMQGIEFQIVNDSAEATKGLEKLGDALSNLRASTETGVAAIGRAANGINRLRKALEDIDADSISKNLAAISDALSNLNVPNSARISATLPKNITSLNTAISGVNVDKLNTFTSGLNAIGAVSDKAHVSATLSTNITALSTALDGLMDTDVAKLNTLAEGLRPLTELGNANLTSFINQLGKFPDVIAELEKADLDKFAQQMQDLATAMKPLADEMNKVAQGFSAFPSQIQKLLTSTGTLNSKNEDSIKKFKSLTKVISDAADVLKQFAKNNLNVITHVGKAIIKINIFSKALKAIGQAVSFSNITDGLQKCIESATEANEVINTFSASLGEYAQAAWDYAQKVEAALGIDPIEFIGEQGVINSIITGFGVAGDKAQIMSQNLVQLGYDLQSLYGEKLSTSQEEMFQKVRSGISGELEPLRNLGFDLSVARLQQEALNLGITQSVSSMTQAEKAQLRYHAMLTQLTQAQGDFARNLATPANMMRILKSQISQLAREIGNLFLPVLKAVLPVLIAITSAIRAIIAAIGTLFGVNVSKNLDGTFESVSGSTEEVEENISDTASGLSDAVDNAKELKNALLGIDELNIISPPDDSATSGSAGNGSGGSGNGSFDLEPLDYSETFLNSAPIKAIEDIKAKLQPFVEWFENSMKRIKTAIDNVDLTNVSSTINKLIMILNNADVKAAVTDMAKELAEMLNNLTSGVDWEGIGMAIGSGISLAISFAAEFIRTYDYSKLGEEIAALVSGAVKKINWEDVGTVLVSSATNLINLLSGFIENVDAEELGTAANTLVTTMLTAIKNALNDVDWNKVGTQLGEFVANLDISAILSSAFEVISTAWGGVTQALGAAGGESPWVTIIAIATGLFQVPWAKIIKLVFTGAEFSKLNSSLGGIAQSAQTTTETATQASGKLAKLKTGFDTGVKMILEVAGTAVILVGAIAFLGWELQKVGEAWQPVFDNSETIIIAMVIGAAILAVVGAVCAFIGGKEIAKDVGAGALVLLEIGAAVAIFIAEIWAIGWGLDKVAQAWQPVVDNQDTVTHAIEAGSLMLVAVGLVCLALGAIVAGTGGLTLYGLIAAGALVLLEIGAAVAIFIAEIWAIGWGLDKVVQAWQPVVDNQGTVDAAIEQGTGLLAAVGLACAALGVITIASCGLLPLAIKMGSDMLEQVAQAVLRLCDNLVAVADKLGNDLAPALSELNEKLPSLADDMSDFVDYMETFAGEVVRYSEASIIAGLMSTIDTIIGWFTEDPFDKLARDVQKISEQTATLNEKLGVAVPELQTAGAMLQQYQSLLQTIEDITSSKVELSSGMFVNMKEVGQKIVTGFVEGIRSKSSDFSNAGKEIVNGFKDSVSTASDNSKSSITAWAANLKKWFTESSFGAISRDTFKTYGKAVVTGFNSGVQGSYADSKACMVAWGTGIQGWFGDKVSYKAFYNIAKDVVDGFNDGINAYYKTTEKYMKKWADAAAAAYKEALDSNSPSKRFMRIGEDTVRGYNIGIENLRDTTRDTMNRWADSFADFAPVTSVTIDPSALLQYGNGRISREISAGVSAYANINDERDSAVTVDDIAEAVLRALQDSGIVEDVRRQADKSEKTVVQIGNRVISDAVSTQQKANGYSFVK